MDFFSKKSSKFFFSCGITSPQGRITVVDECVRDIRSLLLSVGIEINSGPNTLDAALAQLQTLSAGQSMLVTEIL